MTKEPQTTDYYSLIEAFVEGYRGGRDAPGFDACVRAEINKRFSELYKAMPCEQVHFSEDLNHCGRSNMG